MVRSLTRRGMPKPFAILLAALMALYFVPFAALPAQAATVGGFEIEGNLVDDTPADPPIDWFDLGPGSPGFSTGVDNTVGSQDNTTFQGSSKEYDESGNGAWPSWQFGGGNATGKSDFGRWATYDFVENLPGEDHVWFYFAFDRGSGTGTAKYAFELNQVTQSPTTDANPDRSQGDLRLVIYDQGNGVVTLTADPKNEDVGVYVWDDPDHAGVGAAPLDADQDGEWVRSADQTGVFSGSSNTGETPVAVPSWWTGGNTVNGTLTKDTFLEFGIDLTSFGAVLGCPSAGFSAVNARSITGTGGPGTLVDYIAAIPVTIPSNCANLVINKEDEDGDPLGGATFRISPNPLPVGTSGRPDADFLTIFDDSDSNTDKEGTTNFDDPDATAGTITLPAVIPDVEYTITEIIPPAGYIGETTEKKTTPEPFGGSQVTFVNTLGSVTFFKSYEGPNDEVPEGATFRLIRDSDKDGEFGDESGADVITVQDNGTNDEDNTLGEIKVSDLLTGDYRIREIGAPTGWIADGDDVFFAIPGANNTADVVLGSPTFSNPRATYPLTVRKVAKADNSVKIDGAVFDLYRETNGTAGLQLAGDTKVGTCTTGTLPGDDDKGECSVPGLAWGEKYYWYEVSVPAPYNLPTNRVIGPITLNADGSSDPAGTAVIEDPQSRIRTDANDGVLPGATISDTAFVTGVNSSNTGSVTFYWYGPFASGTITPATCGQIGSDYSSGDNFKGEVTVAAPAAPNGQGEWVYSSGSQPVTQSGYYAWIAVYNGDANGNRTVAGICGDTDERSHVPPLQTGLVTAAQAPDAQLPGAELYDTARVSPVTENLDTSVANVDFYLYGPGDADCTGTAVFVSLNRPVTVAQDVNGYYATADSEHFMPTLAGKYRWVAHFDGDVNNEDADSPCNALNEDSTVDRANPDISTQALATDDTLPSSAVQDTATLTGLSANATGTVTFRIYSNDECSTVVTTLGPVAIGTVTGGTATATSPSYTGLTSAGTYFFIASYSGDGNNNGVEGECGDENEDVTINKAQPTVVTEVPFRLITLGPDGSDLTDTATLSGGTTTPQISGEIEFVLYGPFDAAPGPNSCTADKVFNGGEGDHNPQSRTVNGNGSYTTTNAVHVTNVGFYTWIAAYKGDANNDAATHACGLPGETVQVLPRQPVVSTQISATALVIAGQGSVSFSDQATISEATSAAGGTVSFRLYGPGATVAAACDTTGAVQGSPVPVSGNGTYQGPTVSVSTPGYYSWVANYSGDANNLPATHACGLPSETVQVFSGPNPTLQKVADPPTGGIVQRGDLITYTVTVGNTGDVAIEKGVVTDTLPPYVTADQPSVAASGGTYTAGGDRTVSSGVIKWTVDLAPGQSKTFTYMVTVDSDAPELATLVNLAEFFGIQRTTTHRVPAGDLTVAKEVSPVAGNGVVVEFGDELTYTLTATASGEQKQTNVVVTDYVPGFDPARKDSGTTTYVAGSATCIGSGTCTVTEPGADGLITWSLGTMAAGTTRQVTFKVTIDEVSGEPGESVAVDILNAGAVASTETPKNPSNEVVTPVTAVFPVKVGQPPAPGILPRTGSAVGPGLLVGTAVSLLGLGLMLMAAARRRGVHRRQ